MTAHGNSSPMSIRSRRPDLVIALDVDDPQEAVRLAGTCRPARWVKIGPRLFLRGGKSLLESLRAEGFQLFLDLKWHDIPNTVAEAVRAASELNVHLATVHASGGRAMLEAAAVAAKEASMELAAVTVLTSLNEEELHQTWLTREKMQTLVVHLAELSLRAGIAGVVCSPQEITALRNALGNEVFLVTPGVRPAWAMKDDQARVLTPREAAERGADLIVVGRPILKHANPAEAVREILAEIQA